MKIKRFFDDVKAILEHISSGGNNQTTPYSCGDQNLNALILPVVLNCEYIIDPIELSNSLRPKFVPVPHLRYGIISCYLQCLIEELEETCPFVSSEQIGIIESNPLIILHSMSQDDLSHFCKKALELVSEHERCLTDDWRIYFENDIAVLSITLDLVLKNVLPALCHLQEVSHTINEHLLIPAKDKKTGKFIAKIELPHAKVLLQAFAIKINYEENHFVSHVTKLCEKYSHHEETKNFSKVVSSLLSQHNNQKITATKLADYLLNFGTNIKPEQNNSDSDDVSQFKKALASVSLCLLCNQLGTEQTEILLPQANKIIAETENPLAQSGNDIFKKIDQLVTESLNPTLSVLSYIEPLDNRYAKDELAFILNEVTRFQPLCEKIEALINECEQVFSQEENTSDVAIKIQTEILSKAQKINFLLEKKLPDQEIINIFLILSTLGYTILPHLPDKYKKTAIQTLCNLHAVICLHALNMGKIDDAREHIKLHNKTLDFAVDLDQEIIDSLIIRMLFLEANICLVENKPTDAKKKIEEILNSSYETDTDEIEALLQVAVLYYRKGKVSETLSTLCLTLEKSSTQDVTASIVAKSYLVDLIALPEKKSRPPEIIYCDDHQLNKARFKLLNIKVNRAFTLIDDHISQLCDLKNNSLDSHFITEALKLIIIAYCDKAQHYRIKTWQMADGFLQEAKKHLATAKAEVNNELKKTLIPFLESHINDTEYLVQHTLSKKDLQQHQNQFEVFSKNENYEQLLLIRDEIIQRKICTLDSLSITREIFLLEISEIIFDIKIRKLLSWDPKLMIGHNFNVETHNECHMLYALSRKYNHPLSARTECFIEFINLLNIPNNNENKSIDKMINKAQSLFLILNDSVLYSQFLFFVLRIQFTSKRTKYDTLLKTINDLCACVAIVTEDKNATDLVKTQMIIFFKDKLLAFLTKDLTKKGCSIKKLFQIIVVVIEAIKKHGNEHHNQTLPDFQLLKTICDQINIEQKNLKRARGKINKKKQKAPISTTLQTYRLVIQIQEERNENHNKKTLKTLKTLYSQLRLAIQKTEEGKENDFSITNQIIKKYFPNDLIPGIASEILCAFSLLCQADYGFLPIKNAEEIYRLMLPSLKNEKKVATDQTTLDQLVDLQKQHPENHHLNHILGYLYYHMKNTKAKRFLEKASESNHPGAKFLLGKMYCEGKHGCENDFIKSLGFFKQSAKLGHVDAAIQVAKCYKKGINDKLEANKKKVEKYARFAFNACTNDPKKKIEIKEKFELKPPSKKATSKQK